MDKSVYEKHFIALIGGSISGSEAANLLAEKGYRVVVFEMNDLPYGKIEDGLPKWHVGLRDKQERNIDQKLDHKNIIFVPGVKIGRDITFDDLVNNWGFTVIILANGAWYDRPLPIEDIDKFKGKGLIYQNSLLFWYNHKHEPGYKGPQYEIKDGSVVVGGGLASLDVMKLGMIELAQNALKEKKGIFVDLFEFEKKGIATVLEQHNTSLKDLGIKGMTLVYRRAASDMPLKSARDTSPESIKKAKLVSEKLLQKYLDKYLFNFSPLSIPIDKVEENGKLKALVLQKAKIENGRLIPLENETFTLETPMLISSIGSLPEKIKGLEYDGAWLKMKGDKKYRVAGYDNVFAVGNAVTGRGNIQESKTHGKQMTERIIDEQIVDGDLFAVWYKDFNDRILSEVEEEVETIDKVIKNKEALPEELVNQILEKTKTLQQKVGFENYRDWIAEKTPIRLENMTQ